MNPLPHHIAQHRDWLRQLPLARFRELWRKRAEQYRYATGGVREELHKLLEDLAAVADERVVAEVWRDSGEPVG